MLGLVTLRSGICPRKPCAYMTSVPFQVLGTSIRSTPNQFQESPGNGLRCGNVASEELSSFEAFHLECSGSFTMGHWWKPFRVGGMGGTPMPEVAGEIREFPAVQIN